MLVGTYKAAPWAAVIAATGLILGAAYMLWLYRRVMFGEITNPHVAEMPDAKVREWLYFVPLILSVLWLGIHPTGVTKAISPVTKQLLEQIARPADSTAAPAASNAEPEALPTENQ